MYLQTTELCCDLDLEIWNAAGVSGSSSVLLEGHTLVSGGLHSIQQSCHTITQCLVAVIFQYVSIFLILKTWNFVFWYQMQIARLETHFRQSFALKPASQLCCSFKCSEVFCKCSWITTFLLSFDKHPVLHSLCRACLISPVDFRCKGKLKVIKHSRFWHSASVLKGLNLQARISILFWSFRYKWVNCLNLFDERVGERSESLLPSPFWFLAQLKSARMKMV